jgi:threonine dehydrogenase-like Zn-dependent dehydrogenase
MEKFPPQTGQNAVILGGGCIGMLALQCLKNLYGAAEVAVLDIDENKLKRIKETYPEYGDSLKTFHLREPSSATRSSVLPHLEYHPKRLVNYNLDDYITLLMHEHDDLRQLIEDTHGAFADYLFEALPPLPEDKEFPHTRFLGANLLSPSGQYVLFSAEGIEEKTKFFWPVLAKGLALHPAGFDQRSVPMPRTAVDLHMAHAYVNAGIIDLQKLVTCTVDFTNETGVQQAFANYGQGEHMWKTVVKIA